MSFSRKDSKRIKADVPAREKVPVTKTAVAKPVASGGKKVRKPTGTKGE